MSEFGGLWKHQNDPEGTKKCQILHNFEVGHSTKEDLLIYIPQSALCEVMAGGGLPT